ncbi:MAG: hypothetical protein RL216_865 [Pseudomonadota bacterium]|jgi:hypothetical protein
MRVLVLGDSHAACLIEAWREGGWDGAHALAFFARPAGRPFGHVIAGGRITAGSGAFAQFLAGLGQAAAHDLAAQDAVVIVGCGVSLFPLVRVLNVYRVLGWTDRRVAEDVPALTESVLRVALAEALDASVAARLVAELRGDPAMAGKPIHLLPQPFPSERLMTAGGATGAGVRNLVQRGLGTAMGDVFLEEVERFAARTGMELHVQPPETVRRGCLTAEPFIQGARRLVNLAVAQRKEDILHANAAYGRLMLQQLLG